MLKFQQSRPWSAWRRHWAWACGWRARAAGVLLLAALCLRARVPAACELAAELRAPPHRLAELLADFNTLRLLYPHIASWKLESQSSNYTSFRYSLSFACGARCWGAARVLAHDEYAALAHGRALAHRGAFSVDTCRTLPLLPWPAFCEELEVEWSVKGADGAGDEARARARYSERARRRRALGAALLGALGLALGGPSPSLAAARAQHLRALQQMFT